MRRFDATGPQLDFDVPDVAALELILPSRRRPTIAIFVIVDGRYNPFKLAAILRSSGGM